MEETMYTRTSPTFMERIRRVFDKQKEKKGFALTEMILSVLVLGGMLVVAWNIYSRIRESNNVAETKQYLMTAVTQIQQMYSGETYATIKSDLTNAKQIALGLWPKEYFRNNSIHNAWGGQITIDVGTISSGSSGATSSAAGEYFKITFTGLPMKSCVDMAQFGTDWVGVQINSATMHVTNDSVSTDAGKLVTAKAANAECQAGSKNTIVYVSY